MTTGGSPEPVRMQKGDRVEPTSRCLLQQMARSLHSASAGADPTAAIAMNNSGVLDAFATLGGRRTGVRCGMMELGAARIPTEQCLPLPYPHAKRKLPPEYEQQLRGDQRTARSEGARSDRITFCSTSGVFRPPFVTLTSSFTLVGPANASPRTLVRFAACSRQSPSQKDSVRCE